MLYVLFDSFKYIYINMYMLEIRFLYFKVLNIIFCIYLVLNYIFLFWGF